MTATQLQTVANALRSCHLTRSGHMILPTSSASGALQAPSPLSPKHFSEGLNQVMQAHYGALIEGAHTTTQTEHGTHRWEGSLGDRVGNYVLEGHPDMRLVGAGSPRTGSIEFFGVNGQYVQTSFGLGGSSFSLGSFTDESLVYVSASGFSDYEPGTIEIESNPAAAKLTLKALRQLLGNNDTQTLADSVLQLAYQILLRNQHISTGMEIAELRFPSGHMVRGIPSPLVQSADSGTMTLSPEVAHYLSNSFCIFPTERAGDVDALELSAELIALGSNTEGLWSKARKFQGTFFTPLTQDHRFLLNPGTEWLFDHFGVFDDG